MPMLSQWHHFGNAAQCQADSRTRRWQDLRCTGRGARATPWAIGAPTTSAPGAPPLVSSRPAHLQRPH